MMALRQRVVDEKQPEVRLWLAVIEQAVVDAHLHTGESMASVIEAREFIGSGRFRFVCDLLGISADWVRLLVSGIEAEARKVRGKDYR